MRVASLDVLGFMVFFPVLNHPRPRRDVMLARWRRHSSVQRAKTGAGVVYPSILFLDLRTGRGRWPGRCETTPGGDPETSHHRSTRVPTTCTLVHASVRRSDTCRSFQIFTSRSLALARLNGKHQSGLRKSVTAAQLFLAEPLQPAQVGDLDGSRGHAANETLAFQSREGTLGGLGDHAEIISEVEAVHR